MEELIRFQQYMLLIRKAAGWTGEEFGNLIGVTRQTINNLEKNNRDKFKLNKTQYIAMRSVLDAEIKRCSEETQILQLLLNVVIDYPEKYINEEKKVVLDKLNSSPSMLSRSIFTNDYLKNMNDIFKIVLSSGTEGAKYDVGGWLDKILQKEREERKDALRKMCGFEKNYEFITARKMMELNKLSKKKPEKS